MNKKIIAAVSCLCMVSMLFSGCKKNTSVSNEQHKDVVDSNVTKAGEFPVVKEKITLTLGVPGTPKVQDYETNAFTKYLEEKTGIDLKFYKFPASGAMEKLNVMLGSNSELPEVLIGINVTENTFLKYADQEVFLDLTDYIDEYGYYYQQMLEKTLVENLEGYLTSSNGKKYYMPYLVEQQGNQYGAKAWINKKWLDKLNLKMPETTEDFKNVMKAFKTQDPNGNGKADEIGFTGSKDGWNESPVNFLTNSFVYDDYSQKFTVDKNKKVSLAYLSPEYKSAMKYISSMAKEGLLDIQYYTQDTKTLKSIASSDELVIGAFASGSPDVLFAENMEVLNDFVPLPPLKGPKNIAYAAKNPLKPKAAGIITKYCKNPAAAFRLLDFMLSEEASIFARYGVEGKDWKKASENDKCIFENIGVKAKILQILPYGSVQNSHWSQNNPQFRFKEIADGMAWNGNTLDGEYIKAKALTTYMGKEPENVFTKATLTLEEMNEFNELASSISPYASENISLFVSGNRDVDKEWDKFQKELKTLGVDRYVELAQIGYDRFIKSK